MKDGARNARKAEYSRDPPADVRRYAETKDVDGFNHEVRRERLALLRGRLAEFVEVDRLAVACDLMQLVVALVAEESPPPPFTTADKSVVRRRVRDLSDELISERAMSVEGLAYLVDELSMGQQIAIDYFPESHVDDQIEQDMSHRGVIHALRQSVSKSMRKAIKSGLSPYGTTIVATVAALDTAKACALHWSASVRVLVEGLDYALDIGTQDSKESEKARIRAFAAGIRVSERTARRYFKQFASSMTQV
jgi:hypothetical protein